VQHNRITWKCANSIVILSANIGLKPDRIELIYYERDFGIAQFKKNLSMNDEL